MEFDIILGNPPYNGTRDSLSKKNNRKGMVAGFYKLFISKSRNWIKDEGRLIFILPAGGFKSLIKNGYRIDKSRYNPLNSWGGVSVCTANWYCSLTPGLYNFSYSLMDKILKQDYSKMNQNVKAEDGGIFPYNFYSHVITREELEILENKNPYTSGTFRLKSTLQNKINVNILLDYLKPYISQYSFSMYSLTKKLKVEWLEGYTRDITKEDIIKYYQLTKDEINAF